VPVDLLDLQQVVLAYYRVMTYAHKTQETEKFYEVFPQLTLLIVIIIYLLLSLTISLSLARSSKFSRSSSLFQIPLRTPLSFSLACALSSSVLLACSCSPSVLLSLLQTLSLVLSSPSSPPPSFLSLYLSRPLSCFVFFALSLCTNKQS